MEDHLIGGNRDSTLDCRGERTAVVHDDCAGSKTGDPCLAPTNQRLAWLEHGRAIHYWTHARQQRIPYIISTVRPVGRDVTRKLSLLKGFGTRSAEGYTTSLLPLLNVLEGSGSCVSKSDES